MPQKSWKKQSIAVPDGGPTLTARDVSIAPPRLLSKDGIATLRSSLGLSQVVFAQALNVSPDTVRGWEQGKRVPDGASLRLLELAERYPEWVSGAIEASTRSRERDTQGGELDDDGRSRGDEQARGGARRR